MKHPNGTRKRPHGSGSIIVQGDAYHGKWRLGDRQVKRRLGPVRKPGSRDGLTRTQAEAKLRQLIEESGRLPAVSERVTLEQAGRAYIGHLETIKGRKRATIQDYEILLSRHLVPFFGEAPLDRITPDDVARFMSAHARAGAARSSVLNRVNLLGAIFGFALRRRWAVLNPVTMVDKPPSAGPNPDVKYLTVEEVEALIRAVPDDHLGPMERVLYLAAAMTGARQGELIALRWSDVDWTAGLIRVRRTYSRGQMGTPKSRRSSRAIPLPDRLAAELERHFQSCAFQGDDDLVFCHPHTGGPYDASRLRKRFDRAVERAGVREITFHGLRHTFGTQMAAAGTPLRALQEFMGHREAATTAIYSDYAPDPTNGRAWAERAFGGAGTKSGTTLTATQSN